MGLRGRDKHGKKLRWSTKQKDDVILKLFRKRGSKSAADADEQQLEEPGSKRQKLLTAEPSKAREQIVEDTGDILAECAFDESYDEDEEEHIAREARKRREAREAADLLRRQVIVRGIPWDASDVDIGQRFAECGGISKMDLQRTGAGVFRGQARITFETNDAADKALGFNGKYFGARAMSVSTAVPRAPRVKQRPMKEQPPESDSEEGDDDIDELPTSKKKQKQKAKTKRSAPGGSAAGGGKSKGKGKGRGKSKNKGKGKGKGGKRRS